MSLLRTLAFSTVVTAAMAFPVLAADLAPRAVEPAAPAAPEFSWTGLYVGGYAGGSFGTDKLHNPNPANGAPQLSLSPSGFTAGGLAGYNYQYDAFVLGAEGEFGYDGGREGTDFINTIKRPPLRHAKDESSYIGRVRARAGCAIDNILLYGAGGISFTDDKITQTIPQLGFTDSITKDRIGWNIGAGGEYAFTPNWIGRVEYIYDNFSSEKYYFAPQSGHFSNRSSRLDDNTVRAAVEYKF